MTLKNLDNIELSEEEKQIIEDIDNGFYQIVTNEKEIARYASYAENYLKNRQSGLYILVLLKV